MSRFDSSGGWGGFEAPGHVLMSHRLVYITLTRSDVLHYLGGWE